MHVPLFCLSKPVFFLVLQQKFAHLIDLEEDMDAIDDDIGSELLESPEEESGRLSLCMLGNISCFCCCLLTYFKINFFQKFFPAHYQSVKWFGSRSGLTFCRS